MDFNMFKSLFHTSLFILAAGCGGFGEGTPPTAPSVWVGPNVQGDVVEFKHGLVCNIRTEPTDDGDQSSPTYSFAWTMAKPPKGGVQKGRVDAAIEYTGPTNTTTHAGDTIPDTQAGAGTWSCTVTPKDGVAAMATIIVEPVLRDRIASITPFGFDSRIGEFKELEGFGNYIDEPTLFKVQLGDGELNYNRRRQLIFTITKNGGQRVVKKKVNLRYAGTRSWQVAFVDSLSVCTGLVVTVDLIGDGATASKSINLQGHCGE
jgi:hypothetical protein